MPAAASSDRRHRSARRPEQWHERRQTRGTAQCGADQNASDGSRAAPMTRIAGWRQPAAGLPCPGPGHRCISDRPRHRIDASVRYRLSRRRTGEGGLNDAGRSSRPAGGRACRRPCRPSATGPPWHSANGPAPDARLAATAHVGPHRRRFAPCVPGRSIRRRGMDHTGARCRPGRAARRTAPKLARRKTAARREARRPPRR